MTQTKFPGESCKRQSYINLHFEFALKQTQGSGEKGNTAYVCMMFPNKSPNLSLANYKI